MNAAMARRGRPNGSYKLTSMADDLVWYKQLAIERLEARGVPSHEVTKIAASPTSMAQLLKEEFPELFGSPMLTETRLRQLLHKDYLRKKTIDEIDDFERRKLALILGEE
jgi:hypothetical protein